MKKLSVFIMAFALMLGGMSVHTDAQATTPDAACAKKLWKLLDSFEGDLFKLYGKRQRGKVSRGEYESALGFGSEAFILDVMDVLAKFRENGENCALDNGSESPGDLANQLLASAVWSMGRAMSEFTEEFALSTPLSTP